MSQALFPRRRVMWMDPAGPPPARPSSDHCCAEMSAALVNDCAEHGDDAFACPDMLIAYSETFDEYGFIIHDGGPSILTISACPFCAANLPESRRDEWFDRLEALGIDDPFSADLPQEFQSGAWRRAP